MFIAGARCFVFRARSEGNKEPSRPCPSGVITHGAIDISPPRGEELQTVLSRPGLEGDEK